MSATWDIVVVGAGIGGLVAAVDLSVAGLRVCVVEAAAAVGGKAGTVVLDGVEVDTGPSVLTLPDVFVDLFARAGRRFGDYVELLQPEPAFRYVYSDGTALELHHELERTLASVEALLGETARRELAAYLGYAREIWEAAAPHFVFADAPSFSNLLLAPFAHLRSVARIDPLSTLKAAIERRVSCPYLFPLLARFATYNGSDARTAPATLGCIAHVELGLGGYGVRGGMAQIPMALARLAEELGVAFRFGKRAVEILVERGGAQGVRLEGGELLQAHQVVVNADVGALTSGELRLPSPPRSGPKTPSMSAHCGILRARRSPRAAHTVLFPADYEQEFADIFDQGRIPDDPTVYLCAQEVAHGRQGWAQDEPVFVMINAPAVSRTRERRPVLELQQQVLEKLSRTGLAGPGDRFVWWRSPEDLNERFPGSDGALYGAASNDRGAAFARPSNRLPGVRRVYLASGSVHPGGGVPLVAQSGRKAAELAVRDRELGA